MMLKPVFHRLFRLFLVTLEAVCRLFLQMVAFLLLILVPFQSEAYLRVYLRILANVDPLSPKRTLWRRRLNLIGLLLRLKALHFIYLFIFPSQSELDTFFHFDIVDYLIPNAGINGICFLFAILPPFFNKRMFFHAQKQLIEHLISVLHRHSTEWFLSPTFKGKAIAPLLGRLYATIFNLQSTCQLLIEIGIVCFESLLLYKLWNHLTALTLLGHCFFFVEYFLFSSNFCFIIPIAFSTLLTTLAMFHIKMSQIKRKLTLHLKEPQLSNRKLIYLKEQFLSTFSFFLQINSMYRWIFVSYLLAAVPLNAILTICLLLKRIPSENLPFTFFTIYYTFIFIFIFHLAFAYPSKAIHRFGPLFQHILVCKIPTTGKTRTRICLSHLIFAFHVPARDRYGQPTCYGFNYGNWGLVSLENFIKYLLIYAKLAMTLYKLLNE